MTFEMGNIKRELLAKLTGLGDLDGVIRPTINGGVEITLRFAVYSVVAIDMEAPRPTFARDDASTVAIAIKDGARGIVEHVEAWVGDARKFVPARSHASSASGVTEQLYRAREALMRIAGWAAAEQDEELEKEALRGLGE